MSASDSGSTEIGFSLDTADEYEIIIVDSETKIRNLISRAKSFLPSNIFPFYVFYGRAGRGCKYFNAHSNSKVCREGKLQTIDISNFKLSYIPSQKNILPIDIIIKNNPLIIKIPYVMMIDKNYITIPTKTDVNMYQKMIIFCLNLKMEINPDIWMRLAPSAYCQAFLLTNIPFVDSRMVLECLNMCVAEKDKNSLKIIYEEFGTIIGECLEKQEIDPFLLEFINDNNIFVEKILGFSDIFDNFLDNKQIMCCLEKFIEKDVTRRLIMLPRKTKEILLRKFSRTIPINDFPQLIIKENTNNSTEITNPDITLSEIIWLINNRNISTDNIISDFTRHPNESLFNFLKKNNILIPTGEPQSFPALSSKNIKTYDRVNNLSRDELLELVSYTNLTTHHIESIIYYLSIEKLFRSDFLKSSPY